jgi:hypothetical protein
MSSEELRQQSILTWLNKWKNPDAAYQGQPPFTKALS